MSAALASAQRAPRTLVSPTIEEDFAKLFTCVKKFNGGVSSLRGRALPDSFWHMPGAPPSKKCSPAGGRVGRNSSEKATKGGRQSATCSKKGTASKRKSGARKNDSKSPALSTTSSIGSVFLPITERTPRKQSPIQSPSPAAKSKGKKKNVKLKRKLVMSPTDGCGRLSAPVPQRQRQITTTLVNENHLFDDVREDVQNRVISTKSRSHSMPDLGTLWELPESSPFASYDHQFVEDPGVSLSSPLVHGVNLGGHGHHGEGDAELLERGLSSRLWEDDMKLFDDDLVEHEARIGQKDPMVLYPFDDKVSSDYHHSSAFKPTMAGIKDETTLQTPESDLMLHTDDLAFA